MCIQYVMLMDVVVRIVKDNCASSPCQNDGECVDGPGLFTCSCVSGYTGFLCDLGKSRRWLSFN